jgi:hypothetical protein
MKLKDFLQQFEGLYPDTEVYKRQGFEDDPPRKDFSKSFRVFSHHKDEEPGELKIETILV